jgi:hypothetical protein
LERKYQKNKNSIENLVVNTGASILLAYNMIKLINGYCFSERFTESFNIKISNENISKFYNVPIGMNVSIPVEIL